MAKFSAAGSIFNVGTAAGAPTTPVGQVTSGDIDFGELNMIGSTTLADSRDTNLAGTHAPLSGTVTVQFDGAEAGQASCLTKYLAKTLSSFGFTASDTGAAAVYSDGFVTNATMPVAVNDSLQMTITFMGTGAITYAA